MRVLVACEYSGRVRDAFSAKGHDAWSCDLLETERPGQHYQGDVRDMLTQEWDLMICHPPCTHLAVSGARHFARKVASGEQQEALEFVRMLLDAPVPKICLENPVSIISTRIRKPSQVIQPWMFGHGETKATCLWLKGLPKLRPTNPVDGRKPRVHHMPPSPNRWKERSRTYEGIALAMAEQWGSDLTHNVELGVGSRKLCAPSEANNDLEIGILNDVALNVEGVVLRHSLKAKGELLKIAEDRKAGGVVLGHDNLSLDRSAIGLVRADVCEPGVPAENPPGFKNCDTGTSALKV